MAIARAAVVMFLLFATSSVFQGCGQTDKLELKTPYQVIFLDNGNAYIGKVESVGKSYILLSDVFYIQTQVKPETKETTNVLVKRGKELHGPESMYINMQHIMFIEPVTPQSRVAQLIQEEKTRATSGTTP